MIADSYLHSDRSTESGSGACISSIRISVSRNLCSWCDSTSCTTSAGSATICSGSGRSIFLCAGFYFTGFLAFFDVFADALLLFAEDSCKVSSRVFPVAISSLISSVDIILLSETTVVSTGLFSV